jgi:hypothetical protein
MSSWRQRAVAAALLVQAGAALPLAAQQPVRPARRDTLRVDTAAARRLAQDTTRRDTTGDTTRGRRSVPSRPTRQFQPADSIVQRLMTRPGYRVTRYNADSVRLFAADKEIRLAGRALIERDGTTLEADSVRYVEGSCDLFAVGSPRLFDASGVVVGQGMRYDACDRAGIIENAVTDFQEGSALWHLRGDFAVDNLLDRTYAARAEITSCDLPDPHYHFAAREVKYVSKRLMVSRPAVLYVADVPVLWLPFIFQDMRRGRRSGVIPPQFGINDIVRNTPSYQRHIANIGYYWALSDYADAQMTFDWYAQRFTALNGRLRYRWLDRFLSGGVNYQELHEVGGSTSRRVTWSHNQQFSLATQLTAFLDYASSSRVISRNAVDPVLAVATIDSRLNFTHRYPFGTLALGGSRTQSLDKPSVSTTFPTVSFTPNPIQLSDNIVWSPGFSATNSLQSNFSAQRIFPAPGVADSQFVDRRQTTISISSPLRIGRWTWPNSISINDAWTNQRDSIRIVDPLDSSITRRTYTENFETAIDWNTGISLPVLFQGTWNFAPSVQIVNTTGGPFMIRNRFTGGEFVTQGKRLGYSVSIAPTFFGLFGGIGPIARIRHAIAPSLSWSYAPAATVPEAYARAVARGGTIVRRSNPSQTLTISLSQNFEAKLRPPPRPAGDTTTPADGAPAEGRKLRLLSITSSGLSFDIEQGKRPGRTAWLTDSWSNTLSSDLLRGFSLSLTHDLFEGPVGVVGSRLRPSLTSVATGFQIGSGTLAALGGLLGLRTTRSAAAIAADSLLARGDTAGRGGAAAINPFQRGPLATRYSAVDRLAPGYGGQFSASLTFNLQNPRPDPLSDGTAPPRTSISMLAGSMSFRPTRHWNVSWQTSYNVTTSDFSDHVLRLDRDLHDWRATFTFVKSPNGNFLFSFFIQLIDQPEIKFDYDQRNIR